MQANPYLQIYFFKVIEIDRWCGMKERSRTEYSLINMLTGVVGDIVNTSTGLICRVIFVRMLGSEYLGVRGLFTNILSVLSLAELGIESAIIYALYKPIATKDHDKIAAIMQYYRKAYAAIGMVVAVLGLSVLPFLDQIIQTKPDIKESIYLIYLLYLFNTVVSFFLLSCIFVNCVPATVYSTSV